MMIVPVLLASLPTMTVEQPIALKVSALSAMPTAAATALNFMDIVILHLVVFLFSALLDAFKAPPGCGEEIKTFTLDFYSEKSQLQFMLTA